MMTMMMIPRGAISIVVVLVVVVIEFWASYDRIGRVAIMSSIPQQEKEESLVLNNVVVMLPLEEEEEEEEEEEGLLLPAVTDPLPPLAAKSSIAS